MLPPASEPQQKPQDGNGCPYLGLLADQATRHSYPSISNYCHFGGKPEKISLAQQQALCLTPICSRCPIYQGEFEKKRQRPIRTDITAPAVLAQPWAWVVGAAVVIVLLIAAFAWLNESVSSQDSGMGRLTQPAPNLATSTPSKAATVFAIPTMRATSTAVTVTPTATEKASGFATSTHIPGSTTVQIPSATPGPQMETPFGAAHTYLIHKVNAGESLPVLASRYGTSPEAIKKINRLGTATILHPDQILIVMPGVNNDWEAEPLLAVFLEEDLEIEAIASQYGVTIEEARGYNALGQEITILGGRWLVFPFHNITPTPTTAPLDTPELNGTLIKPFGPENSYTIHQVRAGESIGSLERIYNTSAAVIQQINGIEGSIQENQILVILLNQVDAAGLTPLRAILIENETSINELASQLFVLPSEIIYWNGLKEGELIPAGQWIIYPD